MENQNNIRKGSRTWAQKEELILQWQQSGQSRKKFCEQQAINYFTFGTWAELYKTKQKDSTAFQEIKIPSRAGALFAQVHLPGGVKVDIYQAVGADYFRSMVE